MMLYDVILKKWLGTSILVSHLNCSLYLLRATKTGGIHHLGMKKPRQGILGHRFAMLTLLISDCIVCFDALLT